MKVKDMSVTEPGQTMFCICEKKDSGGRNICGVPLMPHNVQVLHKKECTKPSVNRQGKTSARETIAAASINASGIRACAYGGDMGAMGDIGVILFFSKAALLSLLTVINAAFHFPRAFVRQRACAVSTQTANWPAFR